MPDNPNSLSSLSAAIHESGRRIDAERQQLHDKFIKAISQIAACAKFGVPYTENRQQTRIGEAMIQLANAWLEAGEQETQT